MLPFIERLRRTTSSRRNTPVLDLRSALLVSFQELADDERFAEKDLSASTRFELIMLKAGAADDLGDAARKIVAQVKQAA